MSPATRSLSQPKSCHGRLERSQAVTCVTCLLSDVSYASSTAGGTDARKEKPRPLGRGRSDQILLLGSRECDGAFLRPPIGEEANPTEADEHHQPSRQFGNATGGSSDIVSFERKVIN
jgi:hypothetical protein